jgi:16S rRNA (cytosine1402-N4)-methyltransferase
MGAATGAPAPHTPVLYQAVLQGLRPRPGGRYIDGTLGAGGHAAGILQAAAPSGELLGLDLDPVGIGLAKARLSLYGRQLHTARASFDTMAEQAAALGWQYVDGILLDLGLSSMQVDDPRRGFSFREEGPLDMRFDPEGLVTAADLVNGLAEGELAALLAEFGEEPRARLVARAILRERPIQSTRTLAELVARSTGYRHSRIHPATRTFQALRIAVNDELGRLSRALEAAIGLLQPGGRLAVIAFHSLEDRRVKQFFQKESRDCICPPQQPVCTCGHTASLTLVTRRPVRPDEGEIQANPRARSARLRIAERVGVA